MDLRLWKKNHFEICVEGVSELIIFKKFKSIEILVEMIFLVYDI